METDEEKQGFLTGTAYRKPNDGTVIKRSVFPWVLSIFCLGLLLAQTVYYNWARSETSGFVYDTDFGA